MNKLSDDVIIRAVAGEPEAMVTVLKRYDAYVNAYVTDVNVSRSGRKYYYPDEDQKSYIILRLIGAIRKWRPIPYDEHS